MKLSIKQKRFIDEYLKTGNATLSAQISYGCLNKTTAASIGSENLRKPYIKEHIKQTLQSTGLSEEFVIEKLRGILVNGASKEAKPADANRAAELILKTMGAFRKEPQQTNNQYNFNFQDLSISEIREKRRELQSWFNEVLEGQVVSQ